MLEILFDMETRDPDDVMALCFLLNHPRVCLRPITLNPGSPEQIGLVRAIIERLGHMQGGRSTIPIGGRNFESNPRSVSDFHRFVFGEVLPASADAIAYELIAATLQDFPNAIFLTGAPLHNARLLFKHHPDTAIARWVGQGGFAGDNLVEPGDRLEKFAGMETCISRNFSADPKGTQAILKAPNVRTRDLIGKNVCHGLVYDAVMHAEIAPYIESSAGLRLIHECMALYLQAYPEGKMFHDPLAACIAVNRRIAIFTEVEMYVEKGQWGARKAGGTNTFIAVRIDRQEFLKTLLGMGGIDP